METLEAQFKLVHRVKDDKFNIEHLHDYNLLLQIGENNFQLSVVNSNKNKCLLVEDYKLNLSESPILDVLKVLFESHHVLMAGFWNSVKVAFKNSKFTLVPSEHFDKGSKHHYLKLNVDHSTEKAVNYYKLIRSNAVFVFEYSEEITEWLKNIYVKSRVQIVHQGASFIEGVLHNDDHVPGRNMFLLFDSRSLHTLVTESGSLIYYNQTKPSDLKEFVKNILLVLKAMKMEQQTSKVMIWGDVTASSKVFKALYKYIRHVSLGGKPSFLKFNYQFDEISEHKYFPLYSLNICN